MLSKVSPENFWMWIVKDRNNNAGDLKPGVNYAPPPPVARLKLSVMQKFDFNNNN